MSSKFFTTASADFVTDFLSGAIKHLSEEHASLRGPRLGTKIVIEDESNPKNEDTFSRFVFASTRISPVARNVTLTEVAVQGTITKQGDRWTSAKFHITVPADETAWRIRGQMSPEGVITYSTWEIGS